MPIHDPEPPVSSAWYTNPEMLVALSAVVLSLCGLGIALYEASLIRQAQRASVWPHVEVGASIRADEIRLRVENTGVGPARIRAAAATYRGEPLTDWTRLLETVAGPEPDGFEPNGFDLFYSLINGRVLATQGSEIIFSITEGSVGAEVLNAFRQAIFDGSVDVGLCYCSVYDECWRSSLQDLVRRTQGGMAPPGAGAVDSCDAMPQSRI